MVQYSKSILVSLCFAAVFNFSAQAETAPVSDPVEVAEDVLKARAVQAGLTDPAVEPWRVLEVPTADPKAGVEVPERLLSLETETQKWPGRHLGYVLEVASRYGRLDRVRLLLEKKGDIISASDFGDALAAAAANRHPEITKLLLEKKGDVISENSKVDALVNAAESGDLESIKSLHKAGVDVTFARDLPLDKAARNGHLSIIKYLMENGSNVMTPENQDADCRCGPLQALGSAIIDGYMPIVQYMVEEQHIPVNVIREDGVEYSDPLANAFHSRRADMIEYLFSHGASGNDIHVDTAIRQDDWDIVRLAVSHGVDLGTTYRYLEKYKEINVTSLAALKKFMVENDLPIPSAPATSPANPAPSP